MMDATDRNIALAGHYLDIEQPRRALEVLDGREHDVDDPEYWRLRATALVAVERHREALDAVSRGLDLDPSDVGLLLVSALAHRGVGDLAAAERALLAALRIDPEEPALLSQYAILVAHAGQLEKAHRLLDEAERLDPLASHVVHARGVIAYLSGDDAAAARHAETVLAADPEESAAHLLRGSVLSGRGSARAARHHFETAARLDPTDFDVASVARASRWATHPLLWPLLPIQRFGPGKVWLAFIALIALTTVIGIDWLTGFVLVAYLVFVVYSWTVPWLLLRWLKWRSER